MKLSHLKVALFISAVALFAPGCGDNGSDNGGANDGGANGDGGGGGNDGGAGGDGGVNGCTPGGTECNNCVDDDADGRIDGADIHCTSLADDDESSFETGIPGDNVDAVKQDCFFDGDSGAGNDGCDQHICCILGAADQAECDAFGNQLGFNPGNFDPVADCMLSQMCIDECGPITPPGCDCFGCCTLCDGDTCFDVITHPDVAPNCDVDTLGDPAECPRCTKLTDCDNPCDDECVLCPGQDPSDLPASCGGENECNPGQTVCDTTADCDAGQFCAVGCCINQID